MSVGVGHPPQLSQLLLHHSPHSPHCLCVFTALHPSRLANSLKLRFLLEKTLADVYFFLRCACTRVHTLHRHRHRHRNRHKHKHKHKHKHRHRQRHRHIDKETQSKTHRHTTFWVVLGQVLVQNRLQMNFSKSDLGPFRVPKHVLLACFEAGLGHSNSLDVSGTLRMSQFVNNNRLPSSSVLV